MPQPPQAKPVRPNVEGETSSGDLSSPETLETESTRPVSRSRSREPREFSRFGAKPGAGRESAEDDIACTD